MYGSIKYGVNKYAQDASEDDIKTLAPDLMKYLPSFYMNSSETKNIQDAISTAFATVIYSHEELFKQCFIDTATWGLSLWEKEYGIDTDISKSYEDRREVIKAKRRGHGTATKKLIKETAEAFSGGEVDIIEHTESYSFIVQFIGIKGIPKNLAGFKDMLDTIKPAHLAYDFKYTYTVWNFLKDKSLIWNNAKLKTWNDLKVYE